jgi:hypothetical protein
MLRSTNHSGREAPSRIMSAHFSNFSITCARTAVAFESKNPHFRKRLQQESFCGLRQTTGRHHPLTYSSLCASYDLAAARNFGGGFLMKKILVIALFMLATLAWASAQQPGSTPERSSGQATSASSQAPGSAEQGTAQSGMQAGGAQSQAANAPVTEGCLGGSAPNFTITDQAGTTYNLNIPPNADTSKLAQHVGESVQVAGNVSETKKAGNTSIDVQGIGRGTGKCPGGGSSGAQPPPKQ